MSRRPRALSVFFFAFHNIDICRMCKNATHAYGLFFFRSVHLCLLVSTCSILVFGALLFCYTTFVVVVMMLFFIFGLLAWIGIQNTCSITHATFKIWIFLNHLKKQRYPEELGLLCKVKIAKKNQNTFERDNFSIGLRKQQYSNEFILLKKNKK